MKPIMLLGIALIVLGALALAYQGITYTTREKVVDLGPIQASVEKQKTIPLSPILGAGALAAGVAAVHQSPMLFERMTWEENLALGGFDTGAELLDLAAVAARAGALAAKLGFELPPAGTTVENRSVAERVRLEVLRALSFNPRVLVLDEPTGLLAPGELAGFLDVLRRLRTEGRIVILVTHKLGEALAVADRITVLRRGRVVARRARGEVTEEELALLMLGELAPQAVGARLAAHHGVATALQRGSDICHDGGLILDEQHR